MLREKSISLFENQNDGEEDLGSLSPDEDSVREAYLNGEENQLQSAAASGDHGARGVAASEWYYLDNDGQRQGPIDEEMILMLHVLGDIDDETPVWREGMATWDAICRAHPELSAQDSPSPERVYLDI